MIYIVNVVETSGGHALSLFSGGDEYRLSWRRGRTGYWNPICSSFTVFPSREAALKIFKHHALREHGMQFIFNGKAVTRESQLS